MHILCSLHENNLRTKLLGESRRGVQAPAYGQHTENCVKFSKGPHRLYPLDSFLLTPVARGPSSSHMIRESCGCFSFYLPPKNSRNDTKNSWDRSSEKEIPSTRKESRRRSKMDKEWRKKKGRKKNLLKIAHTTVYKWYIGTLLTTNPADTLWYCVFLIKIYLYLFCFFWLTGSSFDITAMTRLN